MSQSFVTDGRKTKRDQGFAMKSFFYAASSLKPVALAALAAIGVFAASPAMAQRNGGTVDFGGESAQSRSIVLPLNKAAIVELPQAAADVLVSQPSVVDAVVRTPRRVYLLGLKVGQTNAFFFDAN